MSATSWIPFNRSKRSDSGPLSRQVRHSNKRLAGLTVSDAPKLPPEKIAKIARERICHIPVAVMEALTSGQVEAMQPKQLRYLSFEQFLAITPHLPAQTILVESERQNWEGRMRIHAAMQERQYLGVYGALMEPDLESYFHADYLLSHWAEVRLALAGIHHDDPKFIDAVVNGLLADPHRSQYHLAEVFKELMASRQLTAKQVASSIEKLTGELNIQHQILLQIPEDHRDAILNQLDTLTRALLCSTSTGRQPLVKAR